MSDPRGLHRKFTVRRTDGSDQPGGKHDGCEYFVLDLTHDAAARSILPALADAYDAHGRPELARDLRAGVPGGGEPQPATSTHNDGPERARQMIDEVTSEHARTWRTPANSQHFVYGPDRAVIACVRSGAPDRPLALHVAAALNAEPVRSAGGGDQPDTPCPHCGGEGVIPKYRAPWLWGGPAARNATKPCPACTDKETPHA